MPTAPHGAFTFGGAVAPSPSEANGTGERAEAYVGAAPPSRKKALRITDSTDLIMVNQKSGKKDAIEWISGLVDNLRARNDPNVVLFGLEQLHNALHSKASR